MFLDVLNCVPQLHCTVPKEVPVVFCPLVQAQKKEGKIDLNIEEYETKLDKQDEDACRNTMLWHATGKF